jgi:NADPH2:quinone reductase
LTDGVGVAAVYDGVGATTLDGSLAALRPRGTLVIFGAASGPTPPVDVRRLMLGGSLFLTRPSVAHYIGSRSELLKRTQEIFSWAAAGKLKVNIAGRYPLEQVADAFEALERRRSTGKLLLTH